MTSQVGTMGEATGGRGARRAAAAFVLVVMAVSCAVFWIGVPAGVLWALSKVTDSFATHLVLGLILVPFAMALFSPVLFWLNNLYLRITGVFARIAAEERETGWQRRVRGPLEPMMLLSFAVALVALFVWFFFYAENPPLRVIG